MRRYADPDRCPDCSTTLQRPLTTCGACGLPLTGDDAAALFQALLAADQYLLRLRTRVRTTEPSAPAVAWQPQPSTAATPPVRWTVPAVLLTLGAACLAVAALVFLAVTWSVLGVGGRTAVLLALTGAAALATCLCARRGLRGAAEAFSVLTGLLAALDLAGGYNAGWMGDLGAASAALLAGGLVAVLAGTGNVMLRGTRTGVLIGPQLVAALGCAVAAGAACLRWPEQLTAVLAVSVLVLAATALVAHRTRQLVLAVCAATFAGQAWLLLVGYGAVRVATDTDQVGPWLVAAALAAGAFAVSLRFAPRGWQVAPGVAAYWLVTASATTPFAETATEFCTAAAVAAVVAAVLAAAVRPAGRTGADVADTGVVTSATLAVTATAMSLTWLAALVGAVLEALADSPLAFTATFDPQAWDGGVAPWTILAAAGAVVATLLAAGRWRAPLGVWVPAGAAVGSVALLGYVHELLAVVVLAALLGASHLAARWAGSGPRPLAWAGAIGWVAVTGVVATYHPGPATAVALLATGLAAVLAFRGTPDERLVAAAAVAPLAAISTAATGWLVDAPGQWIAGAAIVVTGAVATALSAADRPGATVRDALALAVSGIAAVLGALAASYHQGDWVAAYLALLGATAAALALANRSQPLVVLAVAFELAALWVRLAVADVETPEAYTLPLAAVLLGYGAWHLLRDRSLGTLRTLGPGLGAGLGPSLLIAVDDPVSARAAILGLACGLLVAIGAGLRLRAPLLAGAGAGLVLVVAELAPYEDAVPRWVSLSVAGALLLTAGIRWELLAGAGRRGWGRVCELR